MISLTGIMNPETDDEIQEAENPVLTMSCDPFEECIYSDLRERIADYIDKKHPANPNYRKIFLLMIRGLNLSEICVEMDMAPSSIFQYRKSIGALVREYLDLFVEH